MKKFPYLIALGLYALGSIGGFGYSIYSHAYLIAVGVAALSCMAYPKASEYYHKMMD